MWICYDCGIEYGTRRGDGVTTFHENICEWCGKRKSVTHYRHYGYPALPEKRGKNDKKRDD